MIKGISTDHEILIRKIQKLYSDVAREPDKDFHFMHGRPLTGRLKYDPELLYGIPEGAIESFSGAGNPFQIASVKKGETILDIGSGAGMDALIASKCTGESGEVYGLDITPEMIEKSRKNASEMGTKNVRFLKGDAEQLPFEQESIDLVISNGVFYLCDNKETVLKNIFGVLKPGGRLQIADVLLEKSVPESSIELMHLWTRCVAGATLHSDYNSVLMNSGFHNIEIQKSYDIFSEAPVHSFANRYKARGFNIYAEKG